MQTIYLDISKKSIIPPINAKQNDAGRKFKVFLLDGGIPYNADEEVNFSLWYAGESGDGNYDTVAEESAFYVEENSVIVELSPQMLKNPGSGQMCLTMSDADNRTIGLWNIAYEVEAMPGYPSDQKKPYYPSIVRTVNGVAPDENGNVNVEGGSGGSGEPGADGFSPVATVTQTGSGAVISITDKSGTTTATVFNGKDGKEGYTPVKGVDYFDGAPGKDGVDGKDGAKGDKGEPGKNGANGKDGVSATHSWNGTTLTITSASGTSSANLKGEKGDKGDKGDQGIQGEKGETGAAGSNGTNGKDGANGTSVTVKSVSESTADGGNNVVTFSDGKTLTVKNGSKGSKGDKGDKGDTGATGATGAAGKNGADGYIPVKGTDYFTEADKVEIVQRVIESLGGNPIFGIVDENNNIVVSGDLPDGTYSVKYEMENGTKLNIGNLVIDTNVYYTVTNTLTQCTTNNSATKAVQGGSYSATISANSGYELSSVKVTMGGTDISSTAVSGGKITISNVTGNIVITAVATEIVANYTNLFVPSKATINSRINSQNAVVSKDGHIITNTIDVSGKVPFADSTKIYIKGAAFTADGNTKISTYTANNATAAAAPYGSLNGSAITTTNEGNGVFSVPGSVIKTVGASGVKSIIMVLQVSTSAITAADIQNIVITIDEPIA